VTIQLRRSTAASAATSNPTLAAGEPGFETDTGKLKIGDGTADWNSLPYQHENWMFFVTTWTTPPTQVGTTASGIVFEYVFGGVTRYRFVPNSYDATLDAFYSGWDGTELTGLIVARG
jgi:hypothetical protein